MYKKYAKKAIGFYDFSQKNHLEDINQAVFSSNLLYFIHKTPFETESQTEIQIFSVTAHSKAYVNIGPYIGVHTQLHG